MSRTSRRLSAARPAQHRAPPGPHCAGVLLVDRLDKGAMSETCPVALLTVFREGEFRFRSLARLGRRTVQCSTWLPGERSGSPAAKSQLLSLPVVIIPPSNPARPGAHRHFCAAASHPRPQAAEQGAAPANHHHAHLRPSKVSAQGPGADPACPSAAGRELAADQLLGAVRLRSSGCGSIQGRPRQAVSLAGDRVDAQ